MRKRAYHAGLSRRSCSVRETLADGTPTVVSFHWSQARRSLSKAKSELGEGKDDERRGRLNERLRAAFLAGAGGAEPQASRPRPDSTGT